MDDQLLEAARAGEVWSLAQLLFKQDKEFDVNFQSSEDGATAVRIASGNGAEEMVKLLIEAQCNVNIPDNAGWTPLYAASLANSVKVVELLISAKADPNIATQEGASPLYIASLKANYEVVHMLLSANADVQLSDKNGATPLHMTSEHNNADVARLLVKANANVNAVNKYGWTPTHDAAQDNNLESVHLFIEVGANVCIADMDGWTPLYIAAQNGHADMVKLLATVGRAPVNCVDKEGNTPLIVASRYGHVEVVDVLLEVGADLSLRNNEGEDAREVAAVDEVRLLFKYYDLASAAAKNYHMSTSNSNTPIKSSMPTPFSPPSSSSIPSNNINPISVAAISSIAEAKNGSFMSPTVLAGTSTRTPFASHHSPSSGSQHGTTPTAALAGTAVDSEISSRVTQLEQQLEVQQHQFTSRLVQLEQNLAAIQLQLSHGKEKNHPSATTSDIVSGGIITELQLVSAAILFMLCLFAAGSVGQMLGIL